MPPPNISAVALDTMSDEDLLALPASVLAELMQEIAPILSQWKGRDAKLFDIVKRKYAAPLDAALSVENRETGQVVLQDGDFEVKRVTRDRVVSVDQDAAVALIRKITAAGDDPTKYFDTVFRINIDGCKALAKQARDQIYAVRVVTRDTTSLEIVRRS